MSSAELPRWRTEPYRYLFPLGALLSWAGVLHWLLLATGVWNEYRSTFHAVAQIQGFLTCFATGFLFTFVPRRTGAPPARTWQLAVAVLAPLATTALAWREAWVPAQACWLLDVGVVMAFALTRLRKAGSRGPSPAGFVWVPAAFLSAIVAAVIAGIGAEMGPETMWLHDVGRRILQQGFFTALVLGVGSLLLPVLSYGKPPVAPSRRLGAVAFHVIAIAVYFGAFLAEELVSVRLGFALRGLVAAVVLVRSGLAHWPTAPGWHRKVIWLAPWFLPLSGLAGALFPMYPRAALHVAFIGCFGAIVLAVSAHVALSHAGNLRKLDGARWPVAALGVLLVATLGARILVDVDPARFRLWLGIAAASFLAATLVWAEKVARALGTVPPRSEPLTSEAKQLTLASPLHG